MATKKSDGPKAKYKVLSHITHNGETYEPGEDEVIDLSETEAAPLLADKAIAPLKGEQAEPQK
jgi:hypothetical protein